MYFDFTPVKQAKIQQGEFAKIANVTRTTANYWYNGRAVHTLIANKVEVLLKATSLALEAGQLPLDESIPKGQRLPALQTILARYVTQAKAK